VLNQRLRLVAKSRGKGTYVRAMKSCQQYAGADPSIGDLMSQTAAMLDSYPGDLGGIDRTRWPRASTPASNAPKSVPPAPTPASARKWSPS
jgi:hypothetical protein